jgi:hypothetical protein
MKLLMKLIFGFGAVVLLTVAGALFIALDRAPLIDRHAEISPANVEQAKRILDKNDPRNLSPGAVRTIAVKADEVDLAANYLADRFARGSAQVQLGKNAARLQASIRLPLAAVPAFVNLETSVPSGRGLPQMRYLKVGGLRLPGWAANKLLHYGLSEYFGATEVQTVNSAIRRVAIAENELRLTYRWQPQLADTLRNALLPPEEQERLRPYQEYLVSVTRLLRTDSIPLTDLLVPLFSLARQRSAGGDPVAENRAAILTATLYVNERDLSAIIPEAKAWPQPRYKTVIVNKRDDFSKHFMVSAALAAFAGTPLADAVGVYKEIADSQGGSGFSFNDIAADRAGVRFGEQASKDAQSAVRLQRRVAAGITELYIMPITEDLPEFMPEALFKHRYGGVGEPAYNRMMADIEERVNKLPLYR